MKALISIEKFKYRTITHIKAYKEKNNPTHTPRTTLHSLKFSQCRVGAQSLGKRTRSLGTKAVVRETGAGGWKCVSTTRALCLYPIVSLLF